MRVAVYESAPLPGGGARTCELTLPGFRSDVCSAVHPLAAVSPFFSQLGLERFGLNWIQPELSLAHPLDGGRAVVLAASVDATAEQFPRSADAYRRIIAPLAAGTRSLLRDLLRPLRLPRRPILAARFGLYGTRSAKWFAEDVLADDESRALFGGMACHSMMALEKPMTAAFGLMLAILGHSVGWPIPKRGAGAITGALAEMLQERGGKIFTSARIDSLEQLPQTRAVLLDLTPRQILSVAGKELPKYYCEKLRRYRYGCGVYKMDFALSSPAPFSASLCRKAGTVHLGGTFEEMALAEGAVSRGDHPEAPFVLYSQPTVFDPDRCPEGRHVGWAYCHVPNGSNKDMGDAVVAQIERFAPGFRKTILASSVMTTNDLERYNPNCVGGDINGGVQDLRQMFSRPAGWLYPYATPRRGLYICSSSTPPGGGVHGMCGYHAARLALRREFPAAFSRSKTAAV